jgi:hypothetical protein
MELMHIRSQATDAIRYWLDKAEETQKREKPTEAFDRSAVEQVLAELADRQILLLASLPNPQRELCEFIRTECERICRIELPSIPLPD